MFDQIKRFFFEKREHAFGTAEATWRNQRRYNALFALDPDVMVRHLSAYRQGDICGLERVLDEFEQRDDKMRIGAFKMAAAVAVKPWRVQIAQGEEGNARAKLHQRVLTKFWNTIEVTDAFCQNRKGGVRLLVKQMMSAQSRAYAVHDLAWRVQPDGSLKCSFRFIPAWCFENRTGRLRYIRNDGDYTGVDMPEGQWLVSCGEGVGITAMILALAKRLSWNDWLLFNEKCGIPITVGHTDAKPNTPEWDAVGSAVNTISAKMGIVASNDTRIDVTTAGASNPPFRELIETVDRAISALYRGGDLSTMSAGDSVGATSQDGESELMDSEGAAMVAETLHDQIERLVIRFTCGDFEPLAGIVLASPEVSNVDDDIRIDEHLASLGVRLSRRDLLARFGRAEATDESDALAKVGQPAAPGLFNERQAVKTKPDEGALAALRAFAEDMTPASDAIRELLRDPTPEAAAALVEKIPSLLPEDPQLAAILEEETARAFADAVEDEGNGLANEVRRVPGGNGNGGQFTGKTNQPSGKEPEALHKGAKKTITGYETGREKEIAAIRKYPRAHAPGK